MAITTAPFFDPHLAMMQRQLAFQTKTQTADLQRQGQRVQEDMNLFRPFLERRFGRQARQVAGNVAGRGFHGQDSGIMRSQLGELGEEQAYVSGEFERGGARGLEDIQHAISTLTARGALTGAEEIRGGAGRAAERNYPKFQPF